MARRLSIDISDHDAVGVCTNVYNVRFRLQGTETWQSLQPNPFASPIVIDNLLDDSIYEVGVTRNCCNGNVSEEAINTYDTTL